MSKSILVIDTPKCCIDCPCHFVEDTVIVWCGIKKKVLLANDIEVFKPDWCPLLDLPKEKDVVFDDKSIWAERRRGFNSCINEILKEANTE